MTNQNPAVPQSPSPQDRLRQNDILAKVNAHADRSLDRLFADIDDLLSDETPETHSLSVQPSQHIQYSTEPSRTEYYPNQQLQSAPPQPSIDSPPAATPKPKQRLPLWLKALLGIGVTSIAVGGTLLWLVNERKIALPQNIDTSWLPFQSQSQIPPEDAKFADYLRKSISKIDATTSATSVINPVNSANSSMANTTQAAPVAPNPTGAVTTAVPITATPTIATPISLVKTLSDSNRPGAIFEIDRQSQTVNVGQKIGASNWSLLTVAKGEVIVKRKGGEIRSIYIGQKF
ncbi:hypothetical protein [Chamaesiphon sp.]|uniref:hypothetical protein n=1 Tax=Chamaesiphon sp. TaxID=2814140 RepID=UPI0035941D9D